MIPSLQVCPSQIDSHLQNIIRGIFSSAAADTNPSTISPKVTPSLMRAWTVYFGALATPYSSVTDQALENEYQSIKKAVIAGDPLTFSDMIKLKWQSQAEQSCGCG